MATGNPVSLRRRNDSAILDVFLFRLKSDALTLPFAILLLIIGALTILRTGSLNQLAARTGFTPAWVRVVAGVTLLLGGAVLTGMVYFIRTFSQAASGR